MPNSIRLILDSPSSATFNMAVDEVLMESQKDPPALPVLRIYSWKTPAYSIGYFQSVEETKKKFQCEKLKIPVVRRITGGGLVFHGEDLTFSFSVKDPSEFLPRDVKSSYLKINEALMTAFRNLHPKINFADCKTVSPAKRGGDRICFDQPSCYDLLLNGEKVVGSSQRRKDGTLLHQCSVFLKDKKENLIENLLSGFRDGWDVEFLEGSLSASEMDRARQKESERYLSPDWAFRS